MRPRLRLALAACAVALRAGPARASEPEVVRFHYDAAVGCPSEDEFLDAVARDGGLLHRADGADPMRTFTVTLDRDRPAGGHLVVRGVDGHEATRAVRGERCEDVARSLAVLVALSLEPTPESPVLQAPPPPPRVESPPVADTPPVAVEPPVERWRVGVSAEGTLASGAGAGLLAGIAGYAELVHDSRSALAPAFRLGFERTSNDTAAAETVQIVFSRTVARADVCPFRFTARQPWANDALSADLCARLDVGVLDVTGALAPNPPEARYAWVAPGALFRVRWVASPLFFDLEAGVMVPLVRERFYVEPASDVFVIPPVAGVGGFGVGVYFL